MATGRQETSEDLSNPMEHWEELLDKRPAGEPQVIIQYLEVTQPSNTVGARTLEEQDIPAVSEGQGLCKKGSWGIHGCHNFPEWMLA